MFYLFILSLQLLPLEFTWLKEGLLLHFEKLGFRFSYSPKLNNLPLLTSFEFCLSRTDSSASTCMQVQGELFQGHEFARFFHERRKHVSAFVQLRRQNNFVNLNLKFCLCYKGDKGSACLFLLVFFKEILDEKDMVIIRQMRRIINLQNSLSCSSKWLKFSIMFCSVMLG